MFVPVCVVHIVNDLSMFYDSELKMGKADRIADRPLRYTFKEHRHIVAL